MSGTWDRLEEVWPAALAGEKTGWAALRADMQVFLEAVGIHPLSFSHFGVVVADMEGALQWLRALRGDGNGLEVRVDQVEAYHVTVGRIALDGMELELLEPHGDSFFQVYLSEHGDGLHHVSFRVADAEGGLRLLSGRAGEVGWSDGKPREGSHGKVAFLQPRFSVPVCLELCQYER
jgi:hypothetical protein